jgi:hypothetical protein
MYYAASLTLLGGTGDTPLRSLLSKLVDPNEFGKIFTLASVAKSIASLITSSGFQEIYAATVSTFPGTIYVVSAGIVFISLVIYKTIININSFSRNYPVFSRYVCAFCIFSFGDMKKDLVNLEQIKIIVKGIVLLNYDYDMCLSNKNIQNK